MGEACSPRDGEAKCTQVLGGNTSKPRCRREDDIEMELGEIGWCGVEWILVDHDRDKRHALVNTIIKLGFYKKIGLAVGGFLNKLSQPQGFHPLRI
jgi:hypothetical protein